jgi:hypothetical protein
MREFFLDGLVVILAVEKHSTDAITLAALAIAQSTYGKRTPLKVF